MVTESDQSEELDSESEESEESGSESEESEDTKSESESTEKETAAELRERFANYFVNSAGEVPFQWKVLE